LMIHKNRFELNLFEKKKGREIMNQSKSEIKRMREYLAKTKDIFGWAKVLQFILLLCIILSEQCTSRLVLLLRMAVSFTRPIVSFTRSVISITKSVVSSHRQQGTLGSNLERIRHSREGATHKYISISHSIDICT
jgi:hypothetical protein